MKGNSIGEFEELVLLTAAALKEQAYGVAIVEEIEQTTGRLVNIGAIHTVLRRLEDKGLVSSKMSGATQKRGGRRKRIYELTSSGMATLDHLYEVRVTLYRRIRPAAS